MHERSLIQALIEQAQEIACHSHAQRVVEIVVEAGPLSGIEPLLMMSAFEQLTAGTELEEARLTIRKVPLAIRCRACGLESTLTDFVFVCPGCPSGSVQVVSGDGLILRHVELQVSELEAVK